MASGNRMYTYREIGKAAFGVWGGVIVEIFHKTTLLGVCTIVRRFRLNECFIPNC